MGQKVGKRATGLHQPRLVTGPHRLTPSIVQPLEPRERGRIEEQAVQHDMRRRVLPQHRFRLAPPTQVVALGAADRQDCGDAKVEARAVARTAQHRRAQQYPVDDMQLRHLRRAVMRRSGTARILQQPTDHAQRACLVVMLAEPPPAAAAVHHHDDDRRIAVGLAHAIARGIGQRLGERRRHAPTGKRGGVEKHVRRVEDGVRQRDRSEQALERRPGFGWQPHPEIGDLLRISQGPSRPVRRRAVGWVDQPELQPTEPLHARAAMA